MFLLPRRWHPRVEHAVVYDTPARAACAGFWHLHESEPDLAAQAFTRVRHLPFGEELRANAAALAAAARCGSFDQISDWCPPEHPGPDLLRPGVAALLGRLGEIAREAHLVLHSRSVRERGSALNRASGALKDLQGNLESCPEPERIVAKSLDLVLGVATEVGAPVASPYIVGAPVPADRLVGDGLVQRFNQRLREEIQPPPSTLSEEDVEALVAGGALCKQGAVYFRGIWDQASTGPTGQQALPRTLAPHADGLEEARLGQETGLSGTELTAALQALREHDVRIAEAGRCRYAVELTRLWVSGEPMESSR